MFYCVNLRGGGAGTLENTMDLIYFYLVSDPKSKKGSRKAKTSKCDFLFSLEIVLKIDIVIENSKTLMPDLLHFISFVHFTL